MSNILNLKTGEPFDPLPRLHHRPETSLAVSSSVNSSRARGMLLAAKSFYIGGKKWTNPYVTDGLCAMFDGEWNDGCGVHSESRNSLVDLVTGRCTTDFSPVNADVSVHGNYVRLLTTSGYTSSYRFSCSFTFDSPLKIATFEFVFRNNSTNGPACMRLYDNGTSRGCCAIANSSSVNLYPGGNIGVNGLNLDSEHFHSLSAQFSASWPPAKKPTIDGVFYSSTVTSSINFQSYSGNYYSDDRMLIGILGSAQGKFLDIASIRVYNRYISTDEISANHEVDKARFGLT